MTSKRRLGSPGVLQFGVGVPLVLKPVEYGRTSRTIQLPLFWVVKVG